MCKRNDAVFSRSYSGEKLCKRCFSRSVEDRVRKTIAKYKMLNQTDNFMLGVSGGKDSLTLLHILAKLEKGYPNVKFIAGTVDEGIRDYRDEALKIAQDNCKKLGVEHVVVSFKELFGYELDKIVELTKKKQKKGLTPCSYCGVLRRKALNSMAREAKVDKLLTAHNLDDETQTMLLNIFHGDPLRIGRTKPVLNVIHPKLVKRVKPLCMVPEKEVVFYSYLKGIEFQCIDCPYAQDALRNDIRDMLSRMEHKHAGTLFTVFKSMERLQPAVENYFKETKLTECKICGEPTVGDICRACEMLQEFKVI